MSTKKKLSEGPSVAEKLAWVCGRGPNPTISVVDGEYLVRFVDVDTGHEVIGTGATPDDAVAAAMTSVEPW